MGGWRIGFVYAPPLVIEAMVTLQQHLVHLLESSHTYGHAAKG
jgi:aspartate/methionine/tyrosine aminotransferase